MHTSARKRHEQAVRRPRSNIQSSTEMAPGCAPEHSGMPAQHSLLYSMQPVVWSVEPCTAT
eukprot:6377862-Prymnesium_polylepis.1